MAMGGFDREELQAPLAEINTTPLVDVMLVLLVIFLVTAPMLNNSVKLELPNEVATTVDDKNAVTISINLSGQYFWDDKPVSPEEIDSLLKSAAANNSKQPIHLRADTNVAYGKVSHILAAAQRFGLTNVGFITQPE
jgi:biopolymer transport protein ExbD